MLDDIRDDVRHLLYGLDVRSGIDGGIRWRVDHVHPEFSGDHTGHHECDLHARSTRAHLSAEVRGQRIQGSLCRVIPERCSASGRRPRNDETLMMWPLPRSMKWRAAACIPYSADLTLTAIISSRSSPVRSRTERVIPRPALLIQTS